MEPLDADTVNEICEALIGTCRSIGEELDSRGIEHPDAEDAVLAKMDDHGFCCEFCDWWCSWDEAAQTPEGFPGEVCDGCADNGMLGDGEEE